MHVTYARHREPAISITAPTMYPLRDPFRLATAAVIYALSSAQRRNRRPPSTWPQPLDTRGGNTAALFSIFSLMTACIVKTRERFMGIGQVLTMPLFFASNAI
ncbi:hypothetical protein [Acidovorax sp. A1169]|uniref:hypothetical protein n=1 Tax=Acidovorax sp. A1169 TaxID=3059524 RepID=UPI002737D438|nr:hypothetical protein [Acidovorax sp. A1169]MDP4078684.1 hypothetical protein [Acidovorax sp. A1169]